MTLRLSLAFLLLSAVASADSGYHANVHYSNIPVEARVQAFAADASGNFFIVSNIAEPSGRRQLRVDKVDSDGNSLAHIEFGSSGDDSVSGIAIDPAGNVVIAGTTFSTDFPLVSPLFTTSEDEAAFITKLDAKLTKILFSTKLGGTQNSTWAGALTLDKPGNIYVTGGTTDADFPISSGAYQKQSPQSSPSGNAQYAFVTAISSTGQSVIFSTYYGDDTTSCPTGQEYCPPIFTGGSAITLDNAGNVIIAGTTTSAHLPVTSGVFGPSCGACDGSAQAGFFAKFSSAGSNLLWAAYLPVASSTTFSFAILPSSLAVDPSGNIIAAGSSSSALPVTAGAFQTVFPTETNVSVDFPGYARFVLKMDPAAQHLLFCTYFGVQDDLLPFGLTGVAADPGGNIWVSGESLSEKLPLPSGTPIFGEDYLASLSSDGTALTSVFTAPFGISDLAIVASNGNITSLGSTGALLTASQGAGPSLTAVVNSAGPIASGALAPLELVSIYGLGIGPQTLLTSPIVNGALGSALGGVQVLFDGVAAPLLAAGPNRIDAIVPSSVYGRDTTTLQVVNETVPVPALTMQVRPSQPGVVLVPSPSSSFFIAPAPFAAAVNDDGSVNSSANPAAWGSIVTVWVSGAGFSVPGLADGAINTEPAQLALPVSAFSASIFDLILVGSPSGGLSLEVDYAGAAAGMVAGATQINFRLPSDAEYLGNLEFWLQIGDASTETFTLYLQAPPQ